MFRDTRPRFEPFLYLAHLSRGVVAPVDLTGVSRVADLVGERRHEVDRRIDRQPIVRPWRGNSDRHSIRDRDFRPVLGFGAILALDDTPYGASAGAGACAAGAGVRAVRAIARAIATIEGVL